MMKVIPIQCPQCGAQLEVENGRKNYFCTYCGTQIFLDDGTTVHREVDEARIHEAEVSRTIRLKELELEEKKMKNRKIFFIIWLGALAVTGFMSFVTHFFDTDAAGSFGFATFFIGMFGLIFLIYTSNSNSDE